MSHIIQCRICKKKFDTEQEEFVLVGQKSYYHKNCYEQWIQSRNNAKATGDEDFWKESIIDFLYRDIHMKIDFSKLNSQWEHFLKPDKKMTPKGIYFALRYYYTVINGDKEKAQGGIGIVPSIYQTSAKYWTDLENRKEGTLEAIIAEISRRKDREIKIIKKKETKPKKKERFSLNDI